MNQPSNQILRRHASPFTLAAGALAVSLMLAACGGGDPTEPPDTTPPTVAITDNVPGTAMGDVTFTFTFSEDVGTSFTAEDITVDGGTAGAFTKVSATVYTLVVTPPADATGNVTVSVAAAKFRDLALNDNTTSASAAQAYDTTMAAPPPVSGTVLATFDEATPLEVNVFGGTVATLEAGPAGGGSGQALKLVRNGGEPWAGAWVAIPTVPSTTNPRTVTARVYSPTAGIPMVAKLEYGDNMGTGEVSANETVVAGWQTLSWTFNNLDAARVYNRFVILPNLLTVDTDKTYFLDDITLTPAAAPPPAGTATVVADFDTVVPVVRGPDSGGTGTITTEFPAGGGTGSVLAVLRSGGQPWALNVLEASVPFTADRKTVSAMVYSPTAGIRMALKVEGPGGAIELDANETVVVGWQTLTWTFSAASTAAGAYNLLVILPNFLTVDEPPGKTYYFDDFKLLAAATGGGGGGGGGTPTPGGELGSGGPQALTVATGDVKTGDGGNTMFVAGEALFAVNFVGSAEPNPPFNLAAWPNARTADFAGITGISGGDIGYFQDDVNLSNAPQKVDEGGWVAGTALAPMGVPNFFRFFVLSGPVSNEAYMGLYVNAPNNGTVNVSSYSRLKLKVWGPAPMFERTNFNPVLEVTLTGPKVDGCTTGSGGSEITQNLTANLKNGAGGFYTMPLNGFTVRGLCGGDASAADVLAKLARVVVTVPGTSFNYTNLDAGNYATGLNLGAIGFTNN